MEKVNTHKGVTIKALLDSGVTGMFMDRKFVEKHEFRLEELERPIKVMNIDGTENKGGRITNEIECNMYHKRDTWRGCGWMCAIWEEPKSY